MDHTGISCVAFSPACDAAHRQRIPDSTSRHLHHVNCGRIHNPCISNQPAFDTVLLDIARQNGAGYSNGIRNVRLSAFVCVSHANTVNILYSE